MAKGWTIIGSTALWEEKQTREQRYKRARAIKRHLKKTPNKPKVKDLESEAKMLYDKKVTDTNRLMEMGEKGKLKSKKIISLYHKNLRGNENAAAE